MVFVDQTWSGHKYRHLQMSHDSRNYSFKNVFGKLKIHYCQEIVQFSEFATRTAVNFTQQNHFGKNKPSLG